MSRPTVIRLLSVLVALILPTAAIGGPMASGNERGTWIITPQEQGRALLVFLPTASTEGMVEIAATFPVAPLAIASEDNALVLIFPARKGPEVRTDLYPVRRIERRTDPAARRAFSAPGALAPLQITGEILDLTVVDGAPCVLQATGEPGSPSLEILQDNAWSELPLPERSSDGALHLTRLGGQIALMQQPSDTECLVWVAQKPDSDTPDWTRRSIDIPHPVSDVLPLPAGLLRLVVRDGSAIKAFVLRNAALSPSMTVDEASADASVATWGSGLALVRADADAESGLAARLVAPEGEIVFDGPLTVAGPISPAEVQLLIVLLTSVFLTAIIFVLRPEVRPGDVLKFPPGAALASPARRTVAFFIDLIPGLAVAYLVWFAGARSPDEVSRILAERGAAPILVAAGITILLSAIGEATTGRTLGKALVRCRTISFDGGRPSWRQALARSAVKVMCPPLGLFVLMAPASPHPGSFETLVIVDHAAGPPDAAGPGGPNQRSDRSDPP